MTSMLARPDTRASERRLLTHLLDRSGLDACRTERTGSLSVTPWGENVDCVWCWRLIKPPPADSIDAGVVEQLVRDVADVLLVEPGSSPTWADRTARDVVRVVYPTLLDARDRDSLDSLRSEARGMLRRTDVEDPSDAAVELVVSLLRTCRNLYDDSARTRAHYSDQYQQVEEENWRLHQELSGVLGRVRLVRRAVRAVSVLDDRDALVAALREVKRLVRPIRTGRE